MADRTNSVAYEKVFKERQMNVPASEQNYEFFSQRQARTLLTASKQFYDLRES
jgi:hypothetical protein